MIVRLILLIFPFIKEIIFTTGWLKKYVTNPKSMGKFTLVTIITIFTWSIISDMLEQRSKESDIRFRELVRSYYELEEQSFAITQRHRILSSEYNRLTFQLKLLEDSLQTQYDGLKDQDNLRAPLIEKRDTLKSILIIVKEINANINSTLGSTSSL